MADISKIVLPSGNEYDIKDAVARQAIAGGIGFMIVWTQTDWASSTAPDAAKLATIPKDVTVHYNSGASTATGTLVAGESTIGNFYLIYSTTQIGSKDMYNEYVTVSSGGYFWEKIGDTEVDLTGVVTDVSINSTGHTDTVIGTDSTFTITQPTVGLETGATAGTGVISVATGITSVTDPSVTLSEESATATGRVGYVKSVSTTKLSASASGGAVSASGDSVTALTGLGTPSTTSAASSVTPTTKKLATTTITGVSGSTAITPVESRTSQTTADGTGTESTNNADWLKGLSVTGETLTIGAATLDTQTTYSAGAPRASLNVPTAASSTTTVATGSTTTTGSGADVVTDVSVGDTVTVVTGYSSPTTDTVLGTASAFSVTNPSITIASGSSGDVTVATGGTTKYMAAAASGTAVTPTTTNVKATASGANTAWNNKDSVTVLKSDTTLNVTKGTNSGE